MNIGDDNTQDQYKKKTYFLFHFISCALGIDGMAFNKVRFEWPSIRYDWNGK